MAEIQNPNQQGSGGGNDSRTILAFTTIFLLMFLGLQYFKPKKGPEPPPQQQQQQAANTQVPSAAAPATALATQATASSTPAVVASTESETVVENELYSIHFSNRGGQATSWILKKYKTDASAQSTSWIEKATSWMSRKHHDDARPLDLVNQAAAAKFGYPLSLYTYDPALRDRLAKALYVPSSTGPVAAPGKLSFTYADGGLSVTKTFSFDSTYVIHADVQVTYNGVPVTALLAWPSGLGDQNTLPLYASSQFAISRSGKADLEAPKKVSGGNTLNGPFDWAGVSDLYFASIFLPDNPSTAQIVTLNNSLPIPRDREHPDPNVVDQASILGSAVGDSTGHTQTRIFAGPKSLDVLASVRATGPNGTLTGPNIEPVVNFGFWGIIAKPFFLALRWTYEHIVPNWGWAILLLTLVINLAMLPTRIQMMHSALKMQRIQPQMEAIKEKYKKYKANDPKKAEMNQEIFALQKKEGVNMFGGCLPMLIQMPLLFGFYRMLSNVIELRQAHWLWLPDLASPDPLHILPIFIIVSMFLVQYLTPSPGMDPAQQRMMAFTMPAVFGFMMWNLGAGLALYWTFGNVINIIQQTIMNKTKLGREMREIAAKRAARKLGKTIPARR